MHDIEIDDMKETNEKNSQLQFMMEYYNLKIFRFKSAIPSSQLESLTD